MRISEVNGIKLDTEPIVEFTVLPFSNVKLANDNFSLYELKTGKKAKGLSGEQMNKLKIGYVGQSFILQVYETGDFTGTPNNLPKDMGPYQGHGFRFQTYLMVLREAVSK